LIAASARRSEDAMEEPGEPRAVDSKSNVTEEGGPEESGRPAAVNPRREGTVNAGLALVKELTQALIDELKSLETMEGHPFDRRVDFNEEVRRFEVDLIRCALARTGGHQTRAARLLGIKLTTLHDKIKRYKIDPHKV
jgi:DNA-binding NtrC family response regulator